MHFPLKIDENQSNIAVFICIAMRNEGDLMKTRHDWTIEELREIYDLPLLELISKSNHIHVQIHQPSEIQVCSLISIKTGGCPEDCKYCAQSSRYQTPVSAQPMMSITEVLNEAKRAIGRGATRVCLGAAWREVRDSKQFEDVLQMIKQITDMGVEVCCTLGMLKEHQAARLKEAGLYAYNHNLDTSEQFYTSITTTRTYQERLATLDVVQQANLSVCCGGILGMGESSMDRLNLLLTLCRRNPHPESVPVNRLSPISGTPLENQSQISIWEIIRVIAVARIVMPKAMIRLSAGRIESSFEEQTLCFLAGANSIFAGEKLLTVTNTPVDRDEEMFHLLSLKKRPAFSTPCIF
jgi:biotin synthase